jgi:hypothetical protein
MTDDHMLTYTPSSRSFLMRMIHIDHCRRLAPWISLTMLDFSRSLFGCNPEPA